MYFKYFLFCCLGLLCCGVGWSETSPESEGILFQENFEEMETEGLPREFLVLDGEFTVQEIEGNRVVHLPRPAGGLWFSLWTECERGSGSTGADPVGITTQADSAFWSGSEWCECL